jgi:hypothetical protein
MSLQRGINLRALAEKMGQCSGAEVRGICTEAGMWHSRIRIGARLMDDLVRDVRAPRTTATCYTRRFWICGGKGLSFSRISESTLISVTCRYWRRTRKGILRSISYFHRCYIVIVFSQLCNYIAFLVSLLGNIKGLSQVGLPFYSNSSYFSIIRFPTPISFLLIR